MTDDIEISVDELADLPEGSYLIIDIRDEASFDYSSMQGAVNMPDLPETAAARAADKSLPADKKLVLLCMHGTVSLPLAAELRQLGYDACSLKGGLGGWIMTTLDEADRSEEIEKSLRGNKHFHHCLFSKFAKACKDYQLVQPGDRIAVCISGGKDSMLMGKLFQELKRHNKVPFELTFLVMDPGYNEVNRALIEYNARTMGIPVKIFETRIFDAVYNIDKNPCYMCARMRRGHLYNMAKELGCNKIALGHHYDDVIETILMGMLYGSQIQTMMPKLHSEHFEGMELIRPMYLIREKDIKEWRDFNGLHFIQCACHFTDTCSSCREDGTSVSKRMEIKQLIRRLKETNPYVEGNIFKSVENVNLKTIMAYKKDGVKHYFLDDYQ